jgi:hypothetical protein
MKWTKEEEQFLIENYINKTPAKCAEILNRTLSSIHHKASKLKLTKPNQAKLWTDKDEQFLKDNYSYNGPNYCAESLGRTYNSVHLKAAAMGLKCNIRSNMNNSKLVYIVYFPELYLYKIGITNSLQHRIKSWGVISEVLKVKEYSTAQEAAEVERKLLKSVQLVNTGELRNGNTETFTQLSREIEEFLA